MYADPHGGKTMAGGTEIRPFDACLALDGYHCQTNSLAKIFHYHGHPLSEDMILGLGAGMGFIYWKMKMDSGTSVFIGGRGNNKGFFDDVGRRTGVRIRTVTTTSAKKAEEALLERLRKDEPVMLFADMGLLPWFDFPQEYHFGGHSFVVCGFDGRDTVLASDMDSKAAGEKKGFYHPISLKRLKEARSSPYKPFPPKNIFLEFDFSDYHLPTAHDIYSSIGQTAESQLNPPIKNVGVKGIRYAAKEILKWPGQFSDSELRMNLFSLYVFIEIGGTGGGCFRYMYSRFLEESAAIAKNDSLLRPAGKIRRAGGLFSELGSSFKESEKAKDLDERIAKAGALLGAIADIEEDAYTELSSIVG
jgi:hypothetical protein